MKKKLIASILATMILLSLGGCGSKKDEVSQDNESQINTEQKVDEDKVVDDSTSGNENGDDEYVISPPDTEFFKVAKEKDYTELIYKEGQYEQVDQALNIIKTYYTNGPAEIYDKVVYAEYNDGKYLFSPVNDEIKEKLQTRYDYMKKKIPQKITGVTVEDYQWETAIGDTVNSINLSFDLVLETETGDSYMASDGIGLHKDANSELKFDFSF